MTPNKLAATLVGEEHATTFGKQIRGRLRAWYPRANDQRNTSWSLTDEQHDAVVAWYAAKQDGKTFDFETFVTERNAPEATPETSDEPKKK